MRFLPKSILLKTEWNCNLWLHTEATASLEDKKNIQPERYSLKINSTNPTNDFNSILNTLMDYRVYPPSRMQAKICNETNQISKGSTIIQKILIGPIGFEAAVKVVDVFDIQRENERLAGFTYVTLKGHPERGVITFNVSYKKSFGIELLIESWSQPSGWMMSLLRPLSKLIQKASNNQALSFIKRQTDSINGKTV